MIINKDITEFIADKVIENADIETYCQDNFSQSVLVFIGVDNENPPSEIDFPCLIIEPTVKNIGTNDTNFDYEIVLHLAIKGNEKPLKEGNKITYDGVYKIEELGSIITQMMKNEFSVNTNMDTYDLSFYQDEINSFPVYSGVIVVSMSVPNVIGTDKITFN